MPDFEYRAVGRDGVEVRGRESAESRDALALVLRKRQLALLEAKPKRTNSVALSLVVAFVSELSPLLNSGIQLERALQIVAEDTNNRKLADFADRLRGTIKRGQPFSEALAQSGSVDSLFVALVGVGEASGEMAKVMAILDDYYQESRQVRRDLVASLTYPAMLALVSIVSMVAIVWFVVPVFKDIFDEESQRTLPLGTRILFSLSDFLIAHGLISIVLLVVLAAAGVVAVARVEPVNRRWHALQMGAPLLGELLGEFAAFKLARALSIMLTGGTPLAQAVEIARPLLTNPLQREGLENCLLALRKGDPLPRAVARIPGLPQQFHRYVKLGNETGNLGNSLSRVADILQHDFRNRLKSLIAVLDPMIIIAMGGGVGFMVISILLAVFNLADVR